MEEFRETVIVEEKLEDEVLVVDKVVIEELSESELAAQLKTNTIVYIHFWSNISE